MASKILYCFILGDTGSIFPVTITEPTTTINNKEYSPDEITVAFLKELIWEKKGSVLETSRPHITSDMLDLWKVEIKETAINTELLKNTETDIEKVFGGEKLSILTTVEEIFPKSKSKHIHIIVQPPPPPTTGSGQLGSLKTVEDIVREITKDALKRKLSPPNELEMPLQQRNFEPAMRKINQTVKSNVRKMMGKSNYWCLVSGGAPGIGKTRFGHDLYYYVKDKLKLPQEWSNVHFEYICMDFGNGLKLDENDYKLSATVIIGLRIAYSFFIEKEYDIKFREFRLEALRHNKELFNVDTVISSCRKSLNLSDEGQFFLYLHIDEFQLIDIWDKNDKTSTPKELFKNMISDLATYMVPSSPSASTKTFSTTFVQPFLSGTAPYAVIAQKDASKISFDFVECPLLDTASIIRIMDHFASKFNAPTFPNRVYEWKLCAPLLQLLLDTGGLPRALEQVFIQCFWLEKSENNDTFFKELKDQNFNSISEGVKCELEKMYNVKHYVTQNKDLATKILYHCIEGIPVTPDTCLENVKVEHLERDGRVILSKVNDNSDLFLMFMPIFFVNIYNDVLKIVDVELTNKAFRVDNRMFWQEWELFVLHHEALRTNLAIKMGKDGMSLGELYPGAHGEDAYLKVIYVGLKKLSIREANEQFPNKTKLTSKYDNRPIDLESGNVIVLNGASSKFSDIILVRMNGTKYLLMIQCKWDYGSREMTEDAVDDEDIKNLNGLISKVKEMYDGYELITVIFTTQPYNGALEKTGVLIISQDNFDKHFGPVFSSRAVFSFTKAVNPNFWDVSRLINTLEGIGQASIDNVVAKRPYINENQFYEANPRAKKQKLDFFPFDVPGTEAYAPNQ